jgi:hypothetical protein
VKVADLISGGGGAEDESLGEAPPREPSAAAAALRNASLQRHAENEEKKQQPCRFHGVSPTLLCLPFNTRDGERERLVQLATSKESPTGREVCGAVPLRRPTPSCQLYLYLM